MNSSLVSTEWLAEHIADPSLVLLDGRFAMPGSIPTAFDDYASGHIQGAQFFDIDAVSDAQQDLPHMLPNARQFENHMRSMGLSNDGRVVVYDGPGLMSAGRVWWTLRCFGFSRVSVLDGGLKKWVLEDRPLTKKIPQVSPGNFVAQFHPEYVRSKAEMVANLGSQKEHVIDARALARFVGEVAEPRAGLRSGHIPGSHSLPFDQLTSVATGQVLPLEHLRDLFEAAGVDFDRPIAATCGSGVTACALAFGLHLLGKNDVAVYDGAWSEWGADIETPVEQGQVR